MKNNQKFKISPWACLVKVTTEATKFKKYIYIGNTANIVEEYLMSFNAYVDVCWRDAGGKVGEERKTVK